MNFPEVESSSGRYSEGGISRDARNEIVVGFDDETRKLVEQLMGAKRKLQFISIGGKPGIGKTTLARKVYNDPTIVHHFYIRAWTYVTQVPRKRDILLDILRSGFDYKDDDEISDEKLSEMLKRRLSGQRYLIIMDDIWVIESWNQWNDLKWSFPDNKNGSRIMFTSWIAKVAMKDQPQSYKLHLPFLSGEESWNLFQQKVFQKESCPSSLVDSGKKITRKCHGIPLTIVVVAGILANDMTPNWWSQFADDMSNSYEPMRTLALSYNHLPRHLKVCFMYFGAFPENYEIPVWNLILLWVAEGFVHRTGESNLEDIAAGFLNDLIRRSLVIVATRRSDGGIKTCIVHDLLRDICLTKAREENFLQRYARYMNYVSPFETLFRNCVTRRPLCIHSPNSFRVLDLSSMLMRNFPIEIVRLKDLRFISLRIIEGSIPASISNLRYLETLIAKFHQKGVVPKNIWKMINLRHLVLQQVGRGPVDFEDPCFKEAEESYEELLENLETIESLNPTSKFNDQILGRTPNLRKLGFCGDHSYDIYLMLPNLGKLNRLQKLKLVYSPIFPPRNWDKPCTFSNSVFFPATLKRLTLVGTFLAWNEMEKIGMLPNLEVLKLKHMAFIGIRWETSDGGFRRLKFFGLNNVYIQAWYASSEQFPNLRHLKLERCKDLREIPLSLGDIYPLEMLEVRNCPYHVVTQAHRIKEAQERKGNDLLQVSISHYTVGLDPEGSSDSSD